MPMVTTRTVAFVCYPQDKDLFWSWLLEMIGWSTTAVQHHDKTCPGRIQFPHYEWYERRHERAPYPFCLFCFKQIEDGMSMPLYCVRWGVEVWLHRLLRPYYRRQAREAEFGYTMRAIEEYDSARAHGELSDVVIDGMCPKCYLQFDFAEPPWFVCTEGGTSFDGEYDTRWFDGIQYCPRCAAAFEYGGSS